MTVSLMSSMNPALLATGTAATPFPMSEIGGHEFVEIPEGPFVMGSTKYFNAPRQWVKLSSFLMGRIPVTAEQYRSRIETNNSKIMELPSKHAVIDVNWNDATAYLKVLNRETQRVISLPTEAQWEKAARGPAVDLREQMEKDTGRFHIDDIADWVNSELRFENFVTKLELGAQIFNDLKERYLQDLLRNGSPIFAWRVYGSLSGRLTRKEVYYDRRKQASADWGPANAYGLKGMSGGVWEWVLDWYHKDTYRKGSPRISVYDGSDEPYRSSSQMTLVRVNPVAPLDIVPVYRGLRGGSWYTDGVRVDYRASESPDNRSRLGSAGFRLAAQDSVIT